MTESFESTTTMNNGTMDEVEQDSNPNGEVSFLEIFDEAKSNTTTELTSVWAEMTSPETENPGGGSGGRNGNATSAQLQQLGNHVITYAFPLILLLGTVGNILCIVVMQRKAMKRNCSSVYLSALAVADILVLYLSGFKTWLRVTTGFELMHVSDPVCRLTKYAFYSSTHFSAWVIVLVTLERFLVVYTPFRASDLWLVRRPQLTTAVSGLVILVVNSNIVWMSQLVRRPNDGLPMCVSYSTGGFVCSVFPKINLLVYSILPSIFVFTFNVFIIVVIFRKVSSPADGSGSSVITGSHHHQYHHHNFRRRQGHHQRLTVILLTLSTLWLVLSLPYSLVDSAVETLHRLKVPFLVRIVCYMAMYLNHSLNFYVYCLLGQKFRTELRRTFGFRPYSRAARRIHSSKKLINTNRCARLRHGLGRPKMYIDNLYN